MLAGLIAELDSATEAGVSVSVTTANEDATVNLGGTVKAPKTPKGAASAKSKSFALAPQTAELQANQPLTAKLGIPKKAKKLLKKGFAAGKKGKVTVIASATDDLGAQSEDSQKVKIKKKT